MQDLCKTKYPVLLLHGAGFRDDSKFYNYWGRIPETLKEHGAEVFLGNQDAWGSLENNAKIIEQRIKEILKKTGAKKVNLIAHSRGGLEARYVISSLGLDKYIASLTTIATPHRGSKTLDFFYQWPKGIYKFLAFFVDLFYRILGDKKPDFYKSSRQLSAIQCREFNRKNLDKPNVYYQSYMAKMKSSLSDPIFVLTHFIIKLVEGENDGLCTIESGKWGNYRGAITGKKFLGMSHAGVIDVYRFNYAGVDIRRKYTEMVEDLKQRGY